MPSNPVADTFGNRLRVRVCGMLIEQGNVLMVRHRSLNQEAAFWAPPGGGVDYGERLEDALKREFLEETGLVISVDRFLCTHEFLVEPLHGIELFFLVSKMSGALITGADPEIAGQQIIEEVRFLPFPEIKKLPPASVHNLFRHCKNMDELTSLSGLYQYFGERV